MFYYYSYWNPIPNFSPKPNPYHVHKPQDLKSRTYGRFSRDFRYRFWKVLCLIKSCCDCCRLSYKSPCLFILRWSFAKNLFLNSIPQHAQLNIEYISVCISLCNVERSRQVAAREPVLEKFSSNLSGLHLAIDFPFATELNSRFWLSPSDHCGFNSYPILLHLFRGENRSLKIALCISSQLQYEEIKFEIS